MGNKFRDQSPEKCDDGRARRDLAHSCLADDGTAAAPFFRRLTVCQEMAVAFGRGCGFASGRPLGATGPRTESYNWKAKPISPCLGAHEAHPKTTLSGVVFQKLNGPLLTSAPQSPPGSK